MARFQMEARILSVQLTEIDEKIYSKVFVAEDADGKTEQISSVMTMDIRAEVAHEVFAASAGLRFGQLVKLDVETERGGKQATKNVVLHISPADRPAPQSQPAPQVKPAEQPKA